MGSNGGMRYGSSGGGTATAAGVGGAVTAAGVAGMDTLTAGERKSIYEYSGGLYTDINRMARGQEPLMYTRAEVLSHAARIDAAVAKGTLTQATTLYRSTSLKALGLKGPPVAGQVVTGRGLQSTSTQPGQMQSGKFGGNVHMTIQAPRGTHAVDVTHVAGGGESEVLLGRGTRYQVLSVRTEAAERGSIMGPQTYATVRIVR